MKRKSFYTIIAALIAFTSNAWADTDKLPAADGWTKITSVPTASEIANNYYVFVDATQDLMLGIGKGVHQNTQWYSLGVYYRTSVEPTSKDITPMVWTLESYGDGFAMRNLDQPARVFQTEWNKPYFFDTNDVMTPNEWTPVNFILSDGVFRLQNGKYPTSTEDNVTHDDYLGPWSDVIENGAECAANKSGNSIGKFHIYAISRARFKQNLLNKASDSNPVDLTPWYVTNATFDNGVGSEWTSTFTANSSSWWGNHAFSNTGAENYQQVADFYQTLTLPNGKYKVALQGATNKPEENEPYVYGIHNGAKTKTYFTQSTQTTTDGNKWNDMQYTLLQMMSNRTWGQVMTDEITVTTNALTIGYANEGGWSWDVFDNFKIYCYGLDASALAEEGRGLMLAALERFENDYNLQDGTDYRRVTMSADAWATLIDKVNAVSEALDDVSLAAEYGTRCDALIAQMDATDASLRLFKSYKAMVEGTTTIVPGASAAGTDTDTDATETAAITALNTAFVNYALAQDNTIDMGTYLGSNLDFSAAEGAALNTDNSNNIREVSGWEVEYADADTWAVLQTHQSDNDGKLYMRKNWGSSATTLTAAKEKMLPVGKYTLTLLWNSTMENMTNRSSFKVGNADATAIGEATSGAKTLTYDFEITDAPQPFDLVLGFQKTGTGNAPAQIVIDDVTLIYSQPTVILADKGTDANNNPTTITANAGKTCNVTLADRTLYKDGSWNTICLPFPMTADQVAAQLAPNGLMELDTEGYYDASNNRYETNAEGRHMTGLDGTTLYLYFKNATAITAGVPYIIKWNSGDDLVNPVFRGVTVTDGSPSETESKNGTVTFKGTYAPVTLTAEPTNLYLNAANMLNYPAADGFQVNAFRAYFQLSEPAATTAREFILQFGDETATFLHTPLHQQGGAREGFYDLQGRRITNLHSPFTRHLSPMIIIQNGKKVVVPAK